MTNIQTRIDAIREEFQDARPEVVLLIDELVKIINEQSDRVKELEDENSELFDNQPIVKIMDEAVNYYQECIKKQEKRNEQDA